jgi:hypothetical protein
MALIVVLEILVLQTKSRKVYYSGDKTKKSEMGGAFGT